MSYQIPPTKINRIRKAYLNGKFHQTNLAAELGIARNTLLNYLNVFREIKRTHPDRLGDSKFAVKKTKYMPPKSARYHELMRLLPDLVDTAKTEVLQLKPLHRAYRELCPLGFSLTVFSNYYIKWRRENNLCKFHHRRVREISPADLVALKQWKASVKREHWQKAIVLLNSFEKMKLQDSAEQVDVCWVTAQKWVDHYNKFGLKDILNVPRPIRPKEVERVKLRKEKLIRLLHETPALHHINRITWSQESLCKAFLQHYGEFICTSSIGTYLKQEGYTFKKAQRTLTSNDPLFRERLNKVKSVLGSLREDERFFSVDEYGPFALRPKGGYSYSKLNSPKGYNADGKSNGCLICTAAIELSTNQVTHFFSPRKDTEEMIRLINKLREQYSGMRRLYISWDGASWHNSKGLMRFLESINHPDVLKTDRCPEVELVPLPNTAQFLNVIESVFSGLARAVIHNSYYTNEVECIRMVNGYFADRNNYFKEHPKRAGKAIWGQEKTKAVFSEANNCKDFPSYKQKKSEIK